MIQMMKKIIKISFIIILGISLWYFITINKKYNNISNKLDVIISVSKKGKIDSLEYELMNLGGKLDSMILKYDYNFKFTN